ncbi:MAG: translation initiation factor IF-2 [Acidobacteria bacterium]|nr:translation initiation factor IF-2 [Acidobacteriota bacterium]
MEQIKVSELASEFSLQNTVVISELKKIGVWVPSADTPLDNDIATRIRRRLQLIVDMEQDELLKAEKTREKAKEKEKVKEKKTAPAKAAKSNKELGAVRKAKKSEEKPALAEPAAPVSLLKPRKGKQVYRKIETTPAEEVAAPVEEAPVGAAMAEPPAVEEQPIVEKVVAEEAVEISAEEVKVPIPTPEKPAKVKTPEAERPERRPPVKPPEAPAPPGIVTAVRKETPAAPRPAPTPSPTPLRDRERAKLLKRTVPEVTPAQTTEISRRLVKPAPSVEERGRRPAPVPRVGPPRAAKAAAKLVEPKIAPERPAITEIREVTLSEAVTVKELSEKLQIKSKDILRELLNRGVIASVNQTLDNKLVQEVCEVFGAIPHFVSFEEAIVEKEQAQDRPEDLASRAPVVTVMGHVDHGKTSLLDAIRQTRVAAGEAGGITQHIGAYHVNVKDRQIVFLDTPGHEAFTMMRARGAQVTDIVVLVVAADDGVMPQTIEAIHHARAANVPIVVCINKIDKSDAQPQRVKQQLSEHGLLSEDWGGETVMVEVSAREKINLDLLLEMILLVADMRELKANPRRHATGVVLEAKLDRGRGVVATVLVQNGTLRTGDSFIAGAVYGKIRALFSDRGEPVTEAGPSSAVEVLGLQGVPQAGDTFQVIEDSIKARQIGEYRQEKIREKELMKSSRLSLDQLYSQIQGGEIKELPIVLKADVQGSIEALQDTLQKLSTEKVRIKIIHSGVGAITASDVLLASASNAIIIGFHVRPDRDAQELAGHEEVDIRLYTVIYDLSREIRQAMLGLLEPTFRENYLGRAEVRQTFRVARFGTIAGSYVQDGAITRNAEVRLLRDHVVIYEGKVNTLRRFQDDVPEVKAGYECGISLTNFNDVKVGDVIEAFVKEKVEPQLV